jgi:hypothetical protein
VGDIPARKRDGILDLISRVLEFHAGDSITSRS